MSEKERINDNLRGAIRRLMAEDDSVIVLGEDVHEPYGGAFKITKGLSAEYPERVLATPISEEGFVNMAAGMALMGLKPVVDMMFSDFTALAFDPLLNFASKSVTMYGSRLELPMIVRCANGGYRGYGATHSQSMQKYFMGIPNLSVYELSPFHDNYAVLRRMLEEKQPCMLFEEKMIYSHYMFRGGTVNELFSFTLTGEEDNWAVASIEETGAADVLILCPGGLAAMCVAAAEQLILEDEIEVKIAVPSKLYPCRIEDILGEAVQAGRILIVEEGTGGGSWGEVVAVQLYPHLMSRPGSQIRLLHSADSIIPAAVHHEQRVLVSGQDIMESVRQLMKPQPVR
ncbi:alpha-ketoacid dehydrogenase subunit beta [Paenibacillus tengchongensis]|uniref:alpha-ketoacid dehydrogenase subunit beta n=1 Tax=Paenibacillus tengchongensis TaxID=2608684 RepID=UPI00124E9896|nr:transketolase C-terminal domain-containing protein [Paenibacillus tengchongensis]